MSHPAKRLRYTYKNYKCPECQQIITSFVSFKNHRRLHPATVTETNEEISFRDDIENDEVHSSFQENIEYEEVDTSEGSGNVVY